ncbi:SusC/RagA family TonB-linked outer membrane protein [Prevotella herbatica]|uniref:SusC/RagA family TonB-linked outer membrane protein n=2 Tax=Prevotella herbatica TaxID=2801997 RepID=A0ABM7NXX3_9BACT|nr:SusC/RagA family TonB-linked outer membrane protein [Prevotella herbatica]
MLTYNFVFSKIVRYATFVKVNLKTIKLKQMSNLKLKLCLFIALFISMPIALVAQTVKISGVVSDDQDVIIGATVRVKGQQGGTITDIDGKYTLSLPSNAKQIVVSYVGYETRTISVNGRSKIDVKLTSSNQMLDEVVSIGYQKVRKADLTGATSSVGADDLASRPVATAAEALAGKAAGVSVVSQSGAPGADINITVRGGTSITQSTKPLYIVDGFEMENALQQVDINDIETIDIMKDASSTAIYGARGANGVIIITTKNAKAGKTQVNYNVYYSWNSLGKKLDVLNTLDYVKYEYELQVLAGNQTNFAGFYGGDVNASDFYTGAYNRINTDYANRAGVDWQNAVFGGTGFSMNHNLSISGGNDKTKYLLSYNYTGEDGILSKHGLDKNSIRLKLNHELWKGIRFDFSTSFQNTEVEGGGSMAGSLKNVILQPATGGVRFTDDQMLGEDLSEEMMAIDSQYDIDNPLINNSSIDNKSYRRLLTTNAGIEFDFLKHFTWRTAGSYTWAQTRSDVWDKGLTRLAKNNGGPYGSRNNSESSTYQITNTLNWVHNFGLNHLNILLGHEVYHLDNLKLDNEYHNFPEANFGLNNVTMAKPYKWESDISNRALVSFFGRASYNWNERYLVTTALRTDGSSKFSKGHKWGWFPSASAAWRITEEPWIKNTSDWLSNLKLRVGFGTTGNDNIDNNMYATDYGAGYYTNGTEVISTLVPGGIVGNPEIEWEKTTTINIGLDFGFFHSRLNGSIDYYNNKSTNLLIKNKIPTSTGYSYQYQNLASVRNQGVEVTINSTNIRTKEFAWTTDFNIAFNKNKVLKLYGGDNANNYMIQDYDSRMLFYIAEGQPLGQFYGYKADGVYTTDDFTQNADGTYTIKNGVPSLKGATKSNIKPGDIKYACTANQTDKDGNPVWSTDDRTVIGNANPDFVGGMNNTVRYKGFDLSVFLNFSVGGDVFNMNTQRYIGPYLPNQNTLACMANRFTLIDPITGKETKNLSRLAELNPDQYSKSQMWSVHADNKIAISDPLDYYIEDGSYLRFSTITLGYTFPKAWMQKIKVQNMRIYTTLNNIATITGYDGFDPEVSATSSALTPGIDNSAYPRSKSFVIGMNLTF